VDGLFLLGLTLCVAVRFLSLSLLTYAEMARRRHDLDRWPPASDGVSEFDPIHGAGWLIDVREDLKRATPTAMHGPIRTLDRRGRTKCDEGEKCGDATSRSAFFRRWAQNRGFMSV
jgi:hypothetical protein